MQEGRDGPVEVDECVAFHGHECPGLAIGYRASEIAKEFFGRELSAKSVLDKIRFAVAENECVAVLGNNGVGKSMLLKCIVRIYPVKEGAVMVDGRNAYDMSKTEMAQRIAYVSQASDVRGSMTVFGAVLLGRKPYIEWDATDEDKEIAFDVIEKMGLGAFCFAMSPSFRAERFRRP